MQVCNANDSPAVRDHCCVAPIPKIRRPLKVFKLMRRFVNRDRAIESTRGHPIACIDGISQIDN